jgi:26S proteasome regulatory subunit N2
MDAVLDTGFSLSYRNEVLKFLLPLFPLPSSKDRSPNVHSLTRLLVSLGSPELAVPFITSFVPGDKLLAYQLAFDLVEGGAQDFLETIRNELPEGDGVSAV